MHSPDNNFISETVDNYLDKYDGYIPEFDDENDYDYTIEVTSYVQNPVIYDAFLDFNVTPQVFLDLITEYVNGYQFNVDNHTVNNYRPDHLGYFNTEITFTNNEEITPLTLHYKIYFVILKSDFTIETTPIIEDTNGIISNPNESNTVIESSLNYIDEYPNSDNFSAIATIPIFQFWVDDGDRKEGAKDWKGARAGLTNEKVFFNWKREYGTWSDDATVYPEYEGDFIPNSEKQLLIIYPMGSDIEQNILNKIIDAYYEGKDTLSTGLKVLLYISLLVVILLVSLFIVVFVLFIINTVKDYKNKKKNALLDVIDKESDNDKKNNKKTDNST